MTQMLFEGRRPICVVDTGPVLIAITITWDSGPSNQGFSFGLRLDFASRPGTCRQIEDLRRCSVSHALTRLGRCSTTTVRYMHA